LKEEPLNQEDFTDLVLLRLDWITACIVSENGDPKWFMSANINPDPSAEIPWIVGDKKFPGQLDTEFSQLLGSLEDEFNSRSNQLKESQKKNRSFIVGVYDKNKQGTRTPEESISELKELCRSADIHVVDSYIQKRTPDPKTILGSGKLKEIMLKAVQKGVEILIFDMELTAAQAKKISDASDLKIIDRTQLILDIFSRNARSKDGKLQVELAQLEYLKGRLSELDDNMSRLTGGIGGRGPGETKLEIGKRRVEDRIHHLKKELETRKKHREVNRRSRSRNEIPIVGIVGYTNAGKSSLLNILTESDVISENKLFATLDPTTRRVKFPEEREIILSDTVGFIHDLPPELSNAFRATLEELNDSTLLLHVIDVSNPDYKKQMIAVEKILKDLELHKIHRINVFNKIDKLDLETSQAMFTGGIPISTISKLGLRELLDEIEEKVWNSDQTWFQEDLASSIVL
jgi:GTP-binding protein HflX